MASVKERSDPSKLASTTTEADGSSKHPPITFRNFIEKRGQYEPERDRYHLYVSYMCPWATRTLILRKLKALEDIIPITVVSPRMDAHGWPFASVDNYPGADTDPLYKSEHIKDLYSRASSDYQGRFTVPVLWDKKTHTIVNNESSEIIRIFNSAFNELLPEETATLDFYPEDLRKEIDELNEWIHDSINSGVYKSGFATQQEAYEKAVTKVFEGLNKVEKILTGKDYLVGDRLTEADIRLFVTIIRFDPAYVGHFKCNIRTIRAGYPAIHKWVRQLYWNNEAFKSSTNFDHIKAGYYSSLVTLNPSRIVPVGPIPNIELL